MFADRTDFRSSFADVNVSAVAAFLAVFTNANPDFRLFNIGSQFVVAFFMVLFDFCDLCKLTSEVIKPFSSSFFCETFVHIGPFFMFTGSCSFQVFQSGSDTVQSLNQSFACSFSLFAVFSKRAAICS